MQSTYSKKIDLLGANRFLLRREAGEGTYLIKQLNRYTIKLSARIDLPMKLMRTLV